MKSITRNLLIFSSFGIFLSNASQTTFESEIFSYDNVENARNLHVSLKGTNWHAREVKEQDIPFYKDLFQNAEIMKKFGDGQIRLPEATEKRMRDIWFTRFQEGHPHASLTVFESDSQAPIGHAVAGNGEGIGVSEISGAGLPSYWGKGMGTEVMKKIITEWGPEVRRIGLGKNLDDIQDEKIIKAFQCFGGKELCRFDATASPSNPGSWKILDKFGFKAANFKVKSSDPVLNLEQNEFSSPENLEEHMVKLFDTSSNTLLTSGFRYRLIDPEGNVRTFSKHEKYARIKYHFEYTLN